MLYGSHEKLVSVKSVSSLNPYFFGKCSTALLGGNGLKKGETSLNPYFFGKCSTALTNLKTTNQLLKTVLILIFLENALRLKDSFDLGEGRKCLNPYFFGKCSTAMKFLSFIAQTQLVLILIFLENALRQTDLWH